jgi:hypothetical protein
MPAPRRSALLTVDLEDYRSIRLRDHGQRVPPWDPVEICRQVNILLGLFSSLRASATFFSEGRLARLLPADMWREIALHHDIGAHGFSHERVWQQGERVFSEDLRRTRDALAEVSDREIVAFRAPYFSIPGSEPWFGEVLARNGIRFDSSMRLFSPPKGFRGSLSMPGSDGEVMEIPLPGVGFGHRRFTIIGGTYFRLLPASAIIALLTLAEQRGFIPMIYLHPYDVDPEAEVLEGAGTEEPMSARWGDRMRRVGRGTACEKLRIVAATFDLVSLRSHAICGAGVHDAGGKRPPR